jgi:8-oxo-dGTP diphosphatase
MSHEAKIHEAQTLILRELLFMPTAGFTELQKPTGLTSDHFTFHVRRLMDLGYVERAGSGRYQLTTAGKEYANRIDTDNNTLERQPKCAVLLIIDRERDGKQEFLFQQRLKHPYFGFWGRPTGKIRWGETIVETAARELLEETGLRARHKILGLYHELTFQKGTDRLLEDKLFFNVHCSDTQGTLKEQFEGGSNAWMTLAKVLAKPKRFGNFDIGMSILSGERVFVEGRHEYDKSEF